MGLQTHLQLWLRREGPDMIESRRESLKPARLIWGCTAFLSAAISQGAWAQERVTPDISGDVEVASDYRFRGYSRSQEEPVAQASLDATLPVGGSTSLFSGGIGSLTQGNPDYGSFQAQVYAGVEQQVGIFRLSLGGRGYLFPDLSAKDYYELFGSGQTQFGPLSAKLGFAFTPDQRNYGGKRGIYVYSDLDAGIPGTPLTVASHLGWEDNALFRDKLDWSLDLVYVRNPFSLSLGYVDTNRSAPFLKGGKLKNGADAALVVKLGAAF